MELKYSINKNEFDANAKEYIINMHKGSKKLHHKHGCYDSQCLIRYYDFDSQVEAETSVVKPTLCKKCIRNGNLNP